MIKPRRQVVCIATSQALMEEIEQRDLVVIDRPWSDELAAELDSGALQARAIVFGVFGIEKAPRLQRDLSHALKAVAPIAARQNMIVGVEPGLKLADRDRASIILRYALGSYYDARRLIYAFPDVRPIARQLARFDPGPGWKNVELEQSSETILDAEDITLIQRAISDASRARIQRLGDKSIYRVDAQMATEPDRVPLLLKISPRTQFVDGELANYERLCVEAIPYFSLPPLAPERCAAGATKRCLVFHFADHTVTLAESMKTRSPSRAIAALFDGALRQWRANAEEDEIAIGAALFERRIINPMPQIYRKTYLKCRAGDPTVRPPTKIIKDIRSYPKRKVRICLSHGDLHARNVLINEGAEEVSLIDFARARMAPATVDPAELEVSIAFQKVEGLPPLTEVEVLALYCKDLFLESSPLTRAASKRALGVQQVRRQVACEVNEYDYANTLAASLLYYARSSELAYRAADLLSRVRPPPMIAAREEVGA